MKINFQYDDYWYDRYYYFSPLYKSTLAPRRYYYSDYLPNPYYWSWPYSYWTRYKGYWFAFSIYYYFHKLKNVMFRCISSEVFRYDYDYPSFFRRYYLDGYPRYTYGPYYSNLADTLTTSLQRGLSLYRSGLIPYSAFDRYWLTPSYWDRRFKVC